jgi:hypothetical protein
MYGEMSIPGLDRWITEGPRGGALGSGRKTFEVVCSDEKCEGYEETDEKDGVAEYGVVELDDPECRFCGAQVELA